ncbi:MAG TPA: hypothetical protein VEC38_15400 [Candidatus Binataceae bacterium]|nr:hypothetical protein [Candidatus Binataceae bacterium]
MAVDRLVAVISAGKAIRVFLLLLAMLAVPGPADAIDFYEIEVYSIETAAPGHLTLELHSNTVSTATGESARAALNPYQIHETLEATYGVLPFLEVGQYLATARLNNGQYEYAGARTKVHFAVPQSEGWPIEIGGNLQIDYMRRAAESNPLSFEVRPILESDLGRFTLIGNFPFSKPFSGPETHKGVQFLPSGEIAYRVFDWMTPAIEYYSDMGPLSSLPGVQRQQQFIVPALNFDFLPQLELNLGVGVGITRTSNGLFLKSIIGWTF